MVLLLSPSGEEFEITSAQKVAELVHCHGYRLAGADPGAESAVEQPEKTSDPQGGLG